MNKDRLKYIINKINNFNLKESEVDSYMDKVINCVNAQNYNFSQHTVQIITKKDKKRRIYKFPKNSNEDILCSYLNQEISKFFNIRYNSRTKIISLLFDRLLATKSMKDFVIVRADFKSFFDSVLSSEVYENYINESELERETKSIIKKYVDTFKYCYAGLRLSNCLAELICRDFDKNLEANFSEYGIFFYERYVDDIILITNKFISESDLIDIINSTIKKIFKKSPVKISYKKGKYSYIPRRNISNNYKNTISYLGYDVAITSNDKRDVNFNYGISKTKRKNFLNIILKAFDDYKKTNNIELLRQRLKIYSSRVVFPIKTSGDSFTWCTKGIISNYIELHNNIDQINKRTEVFLKNIYKTIEKKNRVSNITPFIKEYSDKNTNTESIYNLYSNLKRKRTILFHRSIGVSRKTLQKWLLNLGIKDSNNDSYDKLVNKYLDIIKIK